MNIDEILTRGVSQILPTKAGLIEARVAKDNAQINMGIPREIDLDISLDFYGY